MSGTRLWLLDEPLTNLDAAGRQFVTGELEAHIDAGGLAVAAVHETLNIKAGQTQTIRLGDPL